MAATYTVGDGKVYSLIQTAIDAIPGDLSGQGKQHVTVYSDGDDDIYTETPDATTGFSNQSSSDYIIIEAMQSHGGLSQNAGGNGIKIDGNDADIIVDLGQYTQLLGFEIGDLSKSGSTMAVGTSDSASDGIVVDSCIIHDVTSTNNHCYGIYFTSSASSGNECRVSNNVLYDLYSTTGSGNVHFLLTWGQDYQLWYYNTIYGANSSVDTGDLYFIREGASGGGTTTGCVIKNNYCAQTGARKAFYFPNATHDYNCSSDDSATGTNSLINKAASAQFEDLTNNSEDFHLKTSADCIEAGTPIAAVTTDFVGETRSETSPDIGAAEYSYSPVTDLYFVGDVDNTWNESGNWSESSGGPGGDGTPDSEQKAHFDSNSPDCTVDVNVNVKGIVFDAGYTEKTVTISGSYSLTVGDEGWSHNGGTLNATGTSGTVTLTGNFSGEGGFVRGGSQRFQISGTADFNGIDFSWNHEETGGGPGSFGGRGGFSR